MVSRPGLGLVGLFFLAGSLVLLWFVVLSGITNTTPLAQTYFLRADTSGISGARATTQWTYFRICGLGNADCSQAWPDPPVGWAWTANPSNAPSELVGSDGDGTTSRYYYYMWRFGWVFYLITLFFGTVAFFMGFLACFGRLGAAVSGFVSMTALFFSTLGTALMTVTFVKMRNAFLADGRSAEIGQYAFGFSWGSWAALLIASILFCIGTAGKDGTSSGRGWRRKRTRSTRSRVSYDVNGRRVKDEYP